MKSMLVTAILLATSMVNAQTIQDAEALFALRGEDTNNAKLAADMYGQIAANEADQLIKGNALTKQSLSLYFFATRQQGSSTKENLHKKAFEIADQAVVTLNKEKDIFGATPAVNSPEGKTALAEAHYASAINMGKWAEARGVLASLGQWGNMKQHLEAVVKNDETVEYYGAYRTFGRAWLKLPFTHGGSKKKSLRDLEYAYTKTFNEDFGTSTNSTTTIFYLDTLVANKVRGDQFCDAYYAFSDLKDLEDDELLELNPNNLPEFKTDLNAFEKEIDFEEDVHGWADSNC